MSTFLTGDALNDAIDNIITDTKKFLFITSPFIKLDDHFRERFDLIKNNPSIYLQIMFGKNENDFYRSVRTEDLEYFKTFPNVSIIYEPRLHAKSYSNENNGIVTSMNLYDYSAENNVEYGIWFGRTKLAEKVYEVHLDNHYKILEESAHCLFIKRPVFKTAIFGLSKNYTKSETLLDLFDSFDPSDSEYERIVYQDIDVISLDEKDLVPVLKSRSEKRSEMELKTQKESSQESPSHGYCIRTGEQIAFNPSQPLSKNAYYEWLEWKNMDYRENFCHLTGNRSYHRNSMRFPILDNNFQNEDIWN
ncbi:hypothetical protein SAMN05192588_0678 [Nonlabens sp. Hel1_33_55]|uniref:phospholipase D family protein n=1 Tax=Nonlabens sp. Hel1_33_55 TaxID=1336802 RepID=UPI000875E2F1|nr:phospholipase D family protein [Nonlabens sp. Hel1_33_55]SCY00333.1 hypothetical protein SAMN05192588_0678 [Nonlabens sp. Hel1_33_55]